LSLRAFYVAEHSPLPIPIPLARKVIYSHKSCDGWAFPLFRFDIDSLYARRAILNNIKWYGHSS
jgi:hypothetical protein